MAERPRPSPDRRIGLPSPPGHVVALIGLSTAGYALALTGVSTLQAAADRGAVADRAPAVRLLDAATGTNDRLAERVDELARRASRSATGYGDLTSGITRVESSLDALAGNVSAVDGASRSLPASVALPPVVRSVRPGGGATSHAATGGSGVP
jgi:hypothetical protein